jgi:transcriptional regulator
LPIVFSTIERSGTVAKANDLLQGTLDLLILKAVSLDPMHGWGITQRLHAMSAENLLVNQGSLYPALERLTRRGALTSEWQTTENNRRARFYRITPAGRRQLTEERAAWKRASSTVNLILDWAGAAP